MMNPTTLDLRTNRVTPSISVAMASFNGEKYIRQQLDSIAKQTLLPLELIITDDGSIDLTLDIIRDFSETSPFPVYLFQNTERLGYANNFMRAARLCKGDLISFCDQDDLWLEQKLESCARAFHSSDVLLCVHSGELWDGLTRSGKKCPGFYMHREFPPLRAYPLQSSYGFAMVIRRQLLDIADNVNRFQKAMPPALPMPHDQWSWFLASIFGAIVVLPDVFVLYRQHAGNVFGGTSGGSIASDAMKARDYRSAATSESRASQFLTNLSQTCDARWQRNALSGSALMALCAEINIARAELHGEGLSILTRFAILSRTFLRTGYAIGKPGARQGLRALTKDLVFAFGGLSKRRT